MSTNEFMTAERLADARAALDEDMSQWGGEYGADLLAEVERLRDELAKAREVTDEKVERVQKIMIDESFLAHEPDPHIRDVVREGIREQARLHVEAVLGGGNDA